MGVHQSIPEKRNAKFPTWGRKSMNTAHGTGVVETTVAVHASYLR